MEYILKGNTIISSESETNIYISQDFIKNKKYLQKNLNIATGNNSYTVNIQYEYCRKVYFKFANLTAESTYMNMIINDINVSGTHQINSGESYIYEMNILYDIPTINVWSNQSSLVLSIYYDTEKDLDETLKTSYKNNIQINGYDAIYKNGYLNSDGSEATGDNYTIGVLQSVSKGDLIKYSSSYDNWNTLFGYKADGTAIALNTVGTNIDEYYVVDNDEIVSIKAFSQKSIVELSLINLGKKDKPLINDSASIIGYCSITNWSSTINSISKQNANITFNSNNGNICFKTKNISITNNNDYIFSRIKLKSNKKCNIELVGYISPTEQKKSTYHLVANKEYDIYYLCKNFINTGTFNLQIQAPIVDDTLNLDILDLVIVSNSLDAWYNLDNKITLKKFTKNLIVDLDGNGQFYDLSHACEFAKNYFDVLNEDVVIHINKGHYITYPTNEYPYVSIDKGANKISIIGDSSNDVIIDCYNSSSSQSQVLNIGGPCTIKGLTIRSLNDGTYNSSNDLGHNPYAIHNDNNFETTEKYTTLVEDCILYSECHSPLGAGLWNNQIQKYRNVYFISNGFISNGACYIHNSVDSTANNMEVIIDTCICESKDNTMAITLGNVDSSYGSIPFSQIPTMIARTIGVTNGDNVTNPDFKNNHLLTNTSCLNNVLDWNY